MKLKRLFGNYGPVAIAIVSFIFLNILLQYNKGSAIQSWLLKRQINFQITDVYLGQAKNFSKLSPGSYVAVLSVDERLSVIRQIVPTGDITLLARNIPELYKPGEIFKIL